MTDYLIASCVFTSEFPELSLRIREYACSHWGMKIVRCCSPKYKLTHFTERMPEGPLRDSWTGLPDTAAFGEGDVVYSLCHNCLNIIEETVSEARVRSVWERIDEDPDFEYPDMTGTVATLQDCWRSRERTAEQDAVRRILDRMNVEWREAEENRGSTEFCGNSLYRPQPPRNPKVAPKHYLYGAEGKFVPHTAEEQERIMEEYCSRFETEKVICYCHYCLEGLLLGKKDAVHLAELLF